MNHKKESIRRPGTRRLVQLYAALLYNANLKGFIDGHIYSGDLKAVCVPGFNCYSCPGAIASCPLGSLQNALNAAGHTAPWYVLGILALFGVILGIRDEQAEKPVRDEKLLRELGSIRERAVHQQADQKTRILRTAVLVIALILIILGILNGGLEDVLAKGAAICTECVGLG